MLLALVNLGLWRQEGRSAYLSWAGSWAFYAARLVFISLFLLSRSEIWLFLHQVATGVSALLLLWAALQFSRGTPFRRRYLWALPVVVLWSWFAVFLLHDFAVAGLSSAVALSAVTLWTGWVFWRYQRQTGSHSARALAWTFLLWGLHHLDYPLLRPLGSGVLLGAMVDVVFIVAAAAGMVFLGLTQGREALAERTTQLEQLTRLLLRAQEEERRRIARDLHDEAGQLLTAVKIELDLAGRGKAADLVGRALHQVRDIGNLLRPSTLDDLGLVPSLRSLVEEGCSIGSHGFYHLYVTEKLRSSDPQAFMKEIYKAKTSVEKMTGLPSFIYAYPFGAFDQAAKTEVERAGSHAARQTPCLSARPRRRGS